jgi:AcrR family transcriptional regulator
MTTSARAADTRHQLLEAARDAFCERGYRATTVAEIVSRAHTARGTFYLYFRNKDEVFAEVLAENCEELLRETGRRYPQDDRPAAVEAATRDYLRAFARRRGVWRAMLEAFGGPSDVERQWIELRARFVDRIARNLRRGVQAGEVRSDLDPVDTAEALAAMTEWLACIEFVMRDEPDHGERYERMVRTVTGLWVLGTAPPL